MNVNETDSITADGTLPAVSGAVSVPKGSAKDGRIQTVVYNPMMLFMFMLVLEKLF